MPPLGEAFKPTSELSIFEAEQKAEIDTRKSVIGQRMQELAPQLTKKGRGGKSAVAHYEHPDLPQGQLMEAFLDRRILRYGSQDEYVVLNVRPVHRRNLKAIAFHAYDERAVTAGSSTNLQINGFFAEGNFNTLGHDQKLELISQTEETLDLIAQALTEQATQQSA